MSKSLLARALGKGPALLFGSACLGGTASIPRVHDTLNPGCFDFTEQLHKRNQEVATRNNAQVSLNSGALSSKAKSEWEKKFASELTTALRNAALRNSCYDFGSSYGSFYDAVGGEWLTRQTKTQAMELVKECGKEIMKILWPKVGSIWKELCSGDFEQRGRFNRNGDSTPALSAVVECVLKLKDDNQVQKILEKYSDFETAASSTWGEINNVKGYHERVTVMVKADSWDGSEKWSSGCSSTTHKR